MQTRLTDANGSISVGINFQADGVVYGLRITAQNYAAIVWPNNAFHPDPFFQEPGQPDGAQFQRTAHNASDLLDFSYDSRRWTPQHWSLAKPCGMVF